MRSFISIILLLASPAFADDAGGNYPGECDGLLQAQDAPEAAPEEYGPGYGLGVELFAAHSLPKRQDQPARDLPRMPGPDAQEEQPQQ